MENKFMRGLREADNRTLTENGATTYKSTLSGLMDLFATGAAYRNRSEEDCIMLFKKAYDEDPVYALKCLFYLHDIREGQGERRFFKVVYRWLIKYDIEAARRNLIYIPFFGRWDNLIYICYQTKLWDDCLNIIRKQLALDMANLDTGSNYGISLLSKWMPSINTSSKKTKAVGNEIRKALDLTPRQYRKTLSILRERINVLERLMSAGEWDKIEFDKIPSKAGFKYRNAFARHDIERMKANKEVVSYKDFMSDKDTKVNAKDLYPYEVVAQAYNLTKDRNYWPWRQSVEIDSVQRDVVDKYWDNLKDYFNSCEFDGLCVIDTSGSMWGSEGSAPINVAITIGLYCAEKARGPFAGYYISFSSHPQLIHTTGIDFVDKVERIYKTNLCENTDIEATFDMLLKTAIKNNCKQEDIPSSLIIVSDMQFDSARGYYGRNADVRSLMENIERKWNAYGYKMPRLYFWQVDARNTGGNIPMQLKDGVTFISGFSPSLFQQIMSGKTAEEFVFDILNSERYAVIK